MRPDPKAAFVLGLIAVLGVVLAGIAFAMDPTVFSRRVPWIARFDAITTLDEGAAVTSHGVVVGRVAALGWEPASQRYRVELRMDPTWLPPADGGVRIEESNPLRLANVAVVDGSGCADRTPGGDDPASGARTVGTCRRVPGMVEIATGILGQAASITTEVQRLLETLGAAVPQTASAPAGLTARSRVEELTDGIVALSQSSKRLVDQLNDLQPQLRGTLASTHDLTADTDAMVRATNQIVETLRRDTLQRVNRTLEATDTLVRGSAAPLQSSLGDLRYILGASSTSVVRLLTQVETMTANLAEITRQLRDDPAVLLHGRSLENPPGTSARAR